MVCEREGEGVCRERWSVRVCVEREREREKEREKEILRSVCVRGRV